jgi:TatD DNase family protein
LHPWYVKTRSTDWADKLESLIQTQKVGIGEIGIDRWIEGRDEAAQDEVFRTQLALARKYDRPAMVHCLQAWGPMMDILRQQAPFEAGLLFHAYGGAIELIPELVAKNVYFSFAGSILRQKNTRAKASVTAVPLDRLLVETDAPDIVLPRRLQPDSLPDERRNEPACAAVILESIAELRGVAKEELADTVWANARRFLKDLWQP